MKHTGSNETVTRVSSERHGLNAVLRNVSNAEHSMLARTTMDQSSAVSWSWDGSCHGGLDVNCGSALRIPELKAAYLTPLAAPTALTQNRICSISDGGDGKTVSSQKYIQTRSAENIWGKMDVASDTHFLSENIVCCFLRRFDTPRPWKISKYLKKSRHPSEKLKISLKPSNPTFGHPGFSQTISFGFGPGAES